MRVRLILKKRKTITATPMITGTTKNTRGITVNDVVAVTAFLWFVLFLE